MSQKKLGELNPNAGHYYIKSPGGKEYNANGGIRQFVREHPEYNTLKWFKNFLYEIAKGNIKDTKVNGKWTYKKVIDEEESGFKHTPISCDQVYFPNFLTIKTVKL